jgi:hypothetical protein
MASPAIVLPRDTFIVTVAGAMNPAIHHAQWYRAIGAIDETELQAALKLPNIATTPTLSQVQFGEPQLTVVCQPLQWSIQSQSSESWERLIHIASLVFSKLNETPVTAYGFTEQRHKDTEAADVKETLGLLITSLNLGFPLGKTTGSTIQLNIQEEDHQVVGLIQPSALSERAVFGFYNRTFPSPRGIDYFDVGLLLKERYSRFGEAANQFFSDLVASINARRNAEVSNG